MKNWASLKAHSWSFYDEAVKANRAEPQRGAAWRQEL